jgi:diacylglycerol kinase family enzyme
MSADSLSHTASLAAADPSSGAEWFIVMSTGSDAEQASQKREAIREPLQAAGRRHRFVEIGDGGIVAACDSAARLAAENGGVLVAAGGDGTVNCAAQAALRYGCPLGVVPMGTFNLFAREHGLPLDPADAVAALLAGQLEPVQAGLVNARVFLVNASIGLYPQLLEDRENAKKQLGKRQRWIAVAAGLVSLFKWRRRLTLDAELDGRLTRLRTPSLFVCNNRLQLRRVGIDEALVGNVGSGRMVALVAHRLGAWGKLKLLLRGLVGKLGEAPELDSFGLRSLDVAVPFARRIKVSTDGEVQWMTPPLRFSVSPRPLCVVVPLPEQRKPQE